MDELVAKNLLGTTVDIYNPDVKSFPTSLHNTLIAVRSQVQTGMSGERRCFGRY
jgi:hypothetical protein